MATTTLAVDGMTCSACSSAVEAGFKNVDGAGTVSVSLILGRAVVQHNPDKLSADSVKAIIEDRGFDAEVISTDLAPPLVQMAGSESQGLRVPEEPGLSTTTLAVEGMTCGACTSAVEGGFKDVAGVKSMSISLLSERAVVEHDPSILSPERIAEIIEDRGFGATVLGTQPSSPPATHISKSGEVLVQKQSDLVTTTVTIEGMTCGSCTSAVEKGFKDVVGVIKFNISLLAERAIITHDPEALSSAQVIEIIEERGFDAKILSSHHMTSDDMVTARNVQLKIFGLSDVASAAALEDVLRLLPGVTSAVVNLSNARASVTHNPTLTGLRAVVEAIENSGYNALIAENDDNNAQLESLAKTREIQEWRRAFWFSLSFAIPVFLTSMVIPMCIPSLDYGSINLWLPGLYLGDVVCLTLTIPVQFGIGKRFYSSAFKSLRHGSPTMDVLVVMGTSAAFFFSVAAMVVSILIPPHTRPSTVFDTSTMLITFITLGRFLENRAKGQTSKSLSRLMSLAPSMATIYTDPIAAEKAAEEWDRNRPVASEKTDRTDEHQTNNAAEEKIIPTELIEVGDVVILRPGDKIPADGTVVRGQSFVDESMVTGEAMPISKGINSHLMAGTVNGAGRVDFRVTRAGRDTQLSQIVRLVQEAQTSRAPIQRMADLVAGYFVPIILALGLLTFVFWMVLSHVLPNPPSVFVRPESGGKFMVCLKLCISVIVFACPCALGLSTPTAVMVGTGVGAEQGILVKGGAALETATQINHVVFDKTGTLTMGKMSVAQVKLESLWEANEWRRRLWWTLVALAEMSSEHPIGKAIVNGARDELGIGSGAMVDGSVGEFEAIVGQGVSAYVAAATSVDSQRYKVQIGNSTYLTSQGIVLPSDIDARFSRSSSTAKSSETSSGTTQIYVAIDGAFTGVISLSDTIKPSASATIAALNHMKITTSIVTGDQLPTAIAVAQVVGIPESNIHAGVSPDEKQTIVRQLQAEGSIVAMVGDGINDSPALATADIGIALSSGTDVAMEAADIVLMRPEDLLSVAESLSLSRTIFNRIRLNLLWACLYNLIGLPFAMGIGLAFSHPVMLPPMAAGAAMAASSVSVVGSSLLLKFWKRPAWMDRERLEMEREKKEGSRGMRSASSQGWLTIEQIQRAARNLMGKKVKRNEGYVPLRDVETA